MVKNNKWMYVVFLLSLINWLPALNIVLIHLPMFKVWPIMIFAYFITPVACALYIIATLVLILKKKSKLLIGCVVITTNLIYLLWGMQYLRVILYAA